MKNGLVACAHRCRKHKIRCHPGEPSRWPCKRCVKQHLDCEVLQHHRGRKRKQPPGGSDDHPQQPQDGKQHVALHSSSNNQIATADHVKTSDPSPTVAERPTSVSLRTPAALSLSELSNTLLVLALMTDLKQSGSWPVAQKDPSHGQNPPTCQRTRMRPPPFQTASAPYKHPRLPLQAFRCILRVRVEPSVLMLPATSLWP